MHSLLPKVEPARSNGGTDSEEAAPQWSNPPESVTRLARLLVRRVEELAAESSEGSPPEAGDLLLDVEVDGVRCSLVAANPAPPQRAVTLSPREKEVARMVADGYPNKTIAAMLSISSWTVSSYLRRIFGKLGVHSRSAMVARLFEEDMIVDRPEARPAVAPWAHAPTMLRAPHARDALPALPGYTGLGGLPGRAGADER